MPGRLAIGLPALLATVAAVAACDAGEPADREPFAGAYAPRGAPGQRIVHLWYADGRAPPTSDPLCANHAPPPAYACRFADSAGACAAAVQDYLARWYEDFDVHFTLVAPGDDVPHDTINPALAGTYIVNAPGLWSAEMKPWRHAFEYRVSTEGAPGELLAGFVVEEEFWFRTIGSCRDLSPSAVHKLRVVSAMPAEPGSMLEATSPPFAISCETPADAGPAPARPAPERLDAGPADALAADVRPADSAKTSSNGGGCGVAGATPGAPGPLGPIALAAAVGAVNLLCRRRRACR